MVRAQGETHEVAGISVRRAGLRAQAQGEAQDAPETRGQGSEASCAGRGAIPSVRRAGLRAQARGEAQDAPETRGQGSEASCAGRGARKKTGAYPSIFWGFTRI